MREITGNMWEVSTYSVKINPDALCITTNGFIKGNGAVVCGRGCAKEATNRYPMFAYKLGDLVRENGNIVQIVISNLISFPVKPIEGIYDGNNVVNHMMHRFNIGDRVPGWAMKADPSIIEESAKQLLKLTNEYELEAVVLPRPGCGAGELKWENVKKILEKYLDDRFYIITFGGFHF